MLGISVYHAIRDAVASVGNTNDILPVLQAPATPESVLNAVMHQRGDSNG
jgi:xanthine dehydrogenase molybdopterin-binding subunit B